MITSEMLSGNTALNGLTDEQKAAIVELSTNDEKAVLANATKAFSEGVSSVLKDKFGTARNATESDADYIARVVGGYADNVKTLTDTNNDLTEKLKKAANLPEELENKYKKQIADAKKLNETLTSTLAGKEKEYSEELLKREKALNDVRLDYAFKDALGGIKFKSTFTPELQKMLLASAKAEVLSSVTPDFVEENGEKVLVFRDADGTIKTNVANGLKPYTLYELLMQTSLKDAVDDGVKGSGGGTKPKGGNGGAGGSFIVTAQTQVEADEEISNYLLSIGKTKYTKEYQDEMARIRKENNVDKLKIR